VQVCKKRMRARCPYFRWELFAAYENPDGRTFHILVVDDTGGAIFCDGFQDRSHAEWTATVLNQAIAVAGSGAGARER